MAPGAGAEDGPPGTIRVSREGTLHFRQRTLHLTEPLPRTGLIEAARPGLQDSSPRSAVIALHARVREVDPDAWRDPGLVQVWGPRGAVYLVPWEDRAAFTLGLSPRAPDERARLRACAERLHRTIDGSSVGDEVTSDVLGPSRQDRLAATTTGRVVLEWDASTLTARVAPSLDVDTETARLELARRFLHACGPATPTGFRRWAGVSAADAEETFARLASELTEVEVEGTRRCILGWDADILAADVDDRVVRLLPPGDPYLNPADRELVAPDAETRSRVWPRSVPPGALLVGTDLVGTWRRRGGHVTVTLLTPVDGYVRDEVEAIVETLPVPDGPRSLNWERVS